MDERDMKLLAKTMADMAGDLKKLLQLQVKVYGELGELLARVNAKEKAAEKRR